MMVSSMLACLQSLSPKATAVAAGSLAAAQDLVARRGTPQLVIVDLKLPDSDGLPTVQAVKDLAPEAKIVVFSATDDAETAQATRLMGTSFISKSSVIRSFAVELRRVLESANLQTSKSPTWGNDAVQALSARQLDVLAELASGCCNREIAERLDISEQTVRTHMRAVFRRLGVQNRTQAGFAYLQWASDNGTTGIL